METPYLALAPHVVDGALAAPLVRPVDDVVVHQASRVDHLRDHGHRTLARQQVTAGSKVNGSGSQSTRGYNHVIYVVTDNNIIIIRVYTMEVLFIK